MPRKTLTVAAVDRIKPPAKGQVEHFDLGFPGLSLRVSYAGAKSWRYSYRLGGIPRRVCLGPYPAISLLEARGAWREARISVQKGVDPNPRHSARSDVFENVAAEWLKRDQADNRPNTIRIAEQMIARDLLPKWRGRQVDTITKRDVLELLDGIADRGAPQQARAVYARIARFFAWCVSRDIVAASPVVGIDKPGSAAARERALNDAEVVAVWNACAEGPFGAATRLLILTGARREEISRLKWSEIDGDAIKLDGSRTKSGEPRTIPLSAPACNLLAATPRTSEYVFTSSGTHPINSWSYAKSKLDEAAKLDTPWVIHDLRRTIATGLQKLGTRLEVIETVLGHISGSRAGIVGVYQRHSYDAEARAAVEAWGAHVVGLVEGREPAKVLPLRRA
jgi:integrase